MKDRLIEILAECLRERRAGPAHVNITTTTDLQRDFGVDSLEGIELTCELSRLLHIEIPLEENIFVKKEEKGCGRIRNVAEIVDRLLELSKPTLPK